MHTVSGSERLEVTFSTHNNEEYATNITANDTTITHHTSTNPVGVEGESVSIQQLNNVQVSEFLSFSRKVEMVSNIPQNLPLTEASGIYATREPRASSITSEEMPPLGVILPSSPLNLNEPSLVSLTLSLAERTAESLLVSAAKAPYEQMDEGTCISIPAPLLLYREMTLILTSSMARIQTAK
jgi:hypothetical protein